MNLENYLHSKIIQNGLAARQNDRLYRLVEASFKSVNAAGSEETQGAYKLIKFLHSDTYHCREENF